jgi:hypothetical protein
MTAHLPACIEHCLFSMLPVCYLPLNGYYQFVTSCTIIPACYSTSKYYNVAWSIIDNKFCLYVLFLIDTTLFLFLIDTTMFLFFAGEGRGERSREDPVGAEPEYPGTARPRRRRSWPRSSSSLLRVCRHRVASPLHRPAERSWWLEGEGE